MSLEIGTRPLAIGGNWIIPKLAKQDAPKPFGSHLVNLGFPTIQRLVQPPDGARVSAGCRDETVSLMAHGVSVDLLINSLDSSMVKAALRFGGEKLREDGGRHFWKFVNLST